MAMQHRPPAVGDDQGLEFRRGGLGFDRRARRLAELEPIEAIGGERDDVGAFSDRWEARPPEHLERKASAPRREVDLGGLRRARQIGDTDQYVVLVLPYVDEHGTVRRPNEAQRAPAENLAGLAHRNQPLGPAQQRSKAAGLGFDVDRLVAVDRVHDHRQVEASRIAAREAAVAIGRPLHGRAHAIAVAQIDIVAHADLVAVIDDRRARERHQQRVHELDLAPVIVHQRGQPSPDAEIDASPRIGGVGGPEIVALDDRSPFRA